MALSSYSRFSYSWSLYPWLAAVGIAVGLAVSPAAAQTVTQKAERDQIAVVAKGDPVMADAMRKARASLSDFLALAAAPKAGMEHFAVKVGVREGDDTEFFWIDPFVGKGDRFSGTVNNEPRSVHSVKLGQTITFTRSDIVDWMYVDGGKMKGNYTACALLKNEPRQEVEEFKQRFGLDCDL